MADPFFHDFEWEQNEEELLLDEESTAAWLRWSNVTIRVKNQTILSNVSGSIKGKFLAVMGSSGGGKTTLLNTLACRIQGCNQSGSIHLNGKKASRRLMKKFSGYVMQDDLFFPTLTVREILRFHARLRLSSKTTFKQKLEQVEDVIHKLGLQKCANSIVGNHSVKGISGGERKRLSIAIELLRKPPLLFLDEPTSGLDSATSMTVLSILKQYTKETTMICTIHQPSTEVFELFDLVMILARGHVVFFGDVEQAPVFFSDCGFPLPPFTNPADHYIDIISADPVDENSVDQMLVNSNKLIEFYQETHHQQEYFENEHSEQDISAWEENNVRHGKCFQFVWLLIRATTLGARNYSSILIQLLQTLILAVFIGLVFLDLPLDQSGIQRRFSAAYFIAISQGYFGVMTVLTTFPMERDIVLRDRAAGVYSALPYFVAKSVAELPFQIFFPLVFTSIAYWMMGFQTTFVKWANFWILCELCNFTAISFGLFISAASPTLGFAAIATSMSMEVFRLFGGFFSQPVRLPGYLLWIQMVSFITYAFTGIARNEIENLKFYCTDDELVGNTCATTTGKQAIQNFDLPDVPVWGCILVLLGMASVFRIFAFFAVRINKKGSG